MKNRQDEIRKRIASRKRIRERNEMTSINRTILPTDEEKYGFNSLASFEGGPGETEHPLFNKELFLFKTLAAACLFLMVGILFRNESSFFEPARATVKKSMEHDFQFAAVSEWYEGKFGKPLALLPSKEEIAKKDPAVDEEYALPASAKLVDNFQKNGQGIMIETEKGKSVSTMKDGFVQFAGLKEGFGKTVIIQHSDNSESWYGNLDDISVNLYDHVEKNQEVGTASESKGEDKSKGQFYFAIKKDDVFIDPIQVIRFE